MIEKYFSEDNVELVEAHDNGTSITFEFDSPDWTEHKRVTLSDLAVAAAIGMSDPKNYSRENFVKEITESFPIGFDRYFTKDWLLPIPEEWSIMARDHVSTMLDTKRFFAIDAGYIRSMEPPLFAYCLLKEVENAYMVRLQAKDAYIPSDLKELVDNPSLLFDEPVTYSEG